MELLSLNQSSDSVPTMSNTAFAISELSTLERSLRNQTRIPTRQAPIHRFELQNEALRKAFSPAGRTTFRYLQEEPGTYAGRTVLFSRLPSFPTEIVEDFGILSSDEDDEDVLYESADSLASWLLDESGAYHTMLAIYLQYMPLLSQHILLASLSDAEFSTSDEHMMFVAESFLMSDEKRLAQGAAIFLIKCCGPEGTEVLQNELSVQELPHAGLIQGAIKLLS